MSDIEFRYCATCDRRTITRVEKSLIPGYKSVICVECKQFVEVLEK